MSWRSFRLLLLLSLELTLLAKDDPFAGVGATKDYVPEGAQHRQARISTMERCQAGCAANTKCKAYAFRTTKPACYFYWQIYMAGTPLSRKMGIYSSGLSIVPKSGFVSAFKHSSFPPPVTPVQRPD